MKLLALAFALFLLPQDEKVTFKFAPKQGDKVKRSRNIEFNLNIEVEMGEEKNEMKVEQRQIEKSTIEYAGVEDGKVTRKVFDFTDHYEEKKQAPMMPDWQRKDNALHGRKVTAFLKDGQLAHEGADGLGEKELAKVQLTDEMAAGYPKDPVAIGGGWELKDDDVRKFLEADQKVKKATMKFKLASVKEVDKRRCAILKATLDLTATPGDEGIEIQVTMEGDLVVWIERGYLLDFKGKGKITLKSDNAQVPVSGKGDITFDWTDKVE